MSCKYQFNINPLQSQHVASYTGPPTKFSPQNVQRWSKHIKQVEVENTPNNTKLHNPIKIILHDVSFCTKMFLQIFRWLSLSLSFWPKFPLHKSLESLGKLSLGSTGLHLDQGLVESRSLAYGAWHKNRSWWVANTKNLITQLNAISFHYYLSQ